MLLCSCREDSHRTSLIAGNMAYNKLFSCTCSIYIYIFSIHFAPHSKVCIQNTLSEILHACNPTSPLRIVHSFCCSWFFEGDSYKRRVLYWSSFNTGLFFYTRNLFSLLLRWFTQVLHGWSVWEGVITSFIFDKTQQFHCNKWNDSFEFITKRT